VVDHPLAQQAVAHAELDEQVDGALLEHAGADTVLDVVARAVLEDDGVDALAVQQRAEDEARRAGPDDPDLRQQPPTPAMSLLVTSRFVRRSWNAYPEQK
jgi:hypothetical protein